MGRKRERGQKAAAAPAPKKPANQVVVSDDEDGNDTSDYDDDDDDKTLAKTNIKTPQRNNLKSNKTTPAVVHAPATETLTPHKSPTKTRLTATRTTTPKSSKSLATSGKNIQALCMNVESTPYQIKVTAVTNDKKTQEVVNLFMWKSKSNADDYNKLTKYTGRVVAFTGIGTIQRSDKYGARAEILASTAMEDMPWDEEQEKSFTSHFEAAGHVTTKDRFLTFVKVITYTPIQQPDDSTQGTTSYPTVAYVLDDGETQFPAKTFIADKITLNNVKNDSYAIMLGNMYINPKNGEKSFTMKNVISFKNKSAAKKLFPNLVKAYELNTEKDHIDLTAPDITIDDLIRSHNDQTLPQGKMQWVKGIFMVVTETSDTLTQVACADCDKLATLNDDDITYECDTHGTDSKFKLVSRPTLQFTISGERNDTPSKKDIDITAQVAKNNELNLLGMDPKDIPKDADVDVILNDLIGKEFFATVGASNTRIIITNLFGA